MKKQQRQLIALIIVLLLLVAGYFGVQRYNEAQSNKEQDEIMEPVFNIASEDVTEISYTHEGEELTFLKEEDVWKYKEDTSLTISQTPLTAMVSALTQMEQQEKIETVAELADYGLEEPEKEITFVANDQTYEVLVGDHNDMTSVYYVTTDGGNTVYAVESTISTAFNYSLEDLIEEEEVEESVEESVADAEASVAEPTTQELAEDAALEASETITE